jgi:hypothetical protein
LHFIALAAIAETGRKRVRRNTRKGYCGQRSPEEELCSYEELIASAEDELSVSIEEELISSSPEEDDS